MNYNEAMMSAFQDELTKIATANVSDELEKEAIKKQIMQLLTPKWQQAAKQTGALSQLGKKTVVEPGAQFGKKLVQAPAGATGAVQRAGSGTAAGRGGLM